MAPAGPLLAERSAGGAMNDLEFVGDYRQPQLSARQRALGHDGSSAGDLTFGDFLDIINPLQHIPLVSTLYRAITGDEISPHARILGATLFGGRSEEHTSELQPLMRNSYAVFCL